MIKSSTKRSFLVVLMLCLCLSLTAFSVTNIASKKAQATQEAWQTGVFEMEDGVSLKLSNSGGLRFIVKMDETVKNFVCDNDSAEFGFIFAPEELMLQANGDYLNMPKKIGGAVDKQKIYKDGDYYYANGCVTNIGANNREFDFVAVAYIKVGETVRYTEYNDYARNSFYDTVNLSVVNGYGEDVFAYAGYSDWYGSNVFPIVVDTNAEYDNVIDFINNSEIDLTSKVVIVEDGATPSLDVDEAKSPSFMTRELFEVDTLISELPDSLSMPDGIGKIRTIREAESKYNALSQADKEALGSKNDKLSSLIDAIEGYDIVYKNDATDGNVVASKVPNYTSTLGGTATSREDGLYGNVLTVTSNANGKAQLSFNNFPSVSKYEKVYFFVKVSVGCNIYLSDGTTNDGWGADWKNNWSVDGYWCNAETWRLVEVDVSSGYINGNFAVGFRADVTGFTFEITDFYGIIKGESTTNLTFGNFVNSGTSNENGTIYNFTQGWSSANDMGAFNQGALRGALASGHDSLYLWIYNPNAEAVNFMFTGDMNSWNPTGDHVTNLPSKTWTKVIITPEIIAQGDNGTWFVNVSSGANTSGWKTSAIYSFSAEVEYSDYADVKDVIALIDTLPTNATANDEELVQSVRNAYDKLSTNQKASVTNYSKLTSAESLVADHKVANEVISMIDSIKSIEDKTLVTNARSAYNALNDAQKALVTNYAKLQDFENQIAIENDVQAKVNNVINLIANLPDSVIMPDHLVFVTRIETARDAYQALSQEEKERVTNYGKLRTLVASIEGYSTAKVVSTDTVSVIPSHVPNYTSTVGGTATTGYDSYYGAYLRVTPDSGGKVAIQFNNFDASLYTKIYFNIRVVGASCDIYLSDGITNDGWGDGWHNTWSMDGFWTNNGNWIQKEVDVSTGIFSSNWALGLRTNTTGVYFEITNIVGYAPVLGTNTGLTFGNFSDSGSVNAYGTVNNFTQGWSSDSDMGAFNQNALANALPEGDDTLHFWIYNPNDTAVDFKITGDMNSWNPIGEYVTNLPSKDWTEVVLTSKIIEEGNLGTWFVNVTTGAGTSGWQISPIYSLASSDIIGKVQARIDSLNSNDINSTAVELAREMYEELSENEKILVDATNLINCETLLYAGVTEFAFVAGSESNYKIYAESSYGVVAQFVREQIENATGATIEIVTATPSNITNYCYAIVIGYEDLVASLGHSIPSDLGRAGYAVKSNGRAVFICANSIDGHRMGALAFLRSVIGYDMLADDCVVYTKDGSTVSANLNIVERPFDYRQQQTYMTESEVYGMGMQSHTDLWIASSEGWDMHNSLHYLPVSTYRSAHSSWYYDYKDSAGTTRTQICPTAGGNSEEFDAMTTAIANAMLERINLFPNKENISFSIMDTADNDDCTCSRCELYDTLYGEGGFAAAWIDLMNAVNAKIRLQLAEGKKLNIAFLAYRGTEKAPANIDGNGNVTLLKRYEIADNGTYTLTNQDLKCDEGVTVWLAPINGLYAENFNHSGNATTLATIKKWCAISDSVFLWLYGTNFKYYMYPYNTWQASAENYKILYDLGVKGVWSQSNETEATAFSDLKSYIDSKFMVNVNADYDQVLNDYFTNYYGPASAKMREMFNYIVNRCNEIEANNGVGQGIYDELEYEKGWLVKTRYSYWTESELNSLVTLCNEAKALVNADNSLSAEQKSAIINRITKESLFPRFVLCTIYKQTSDRAQFKADCNALGVTLYKEAGGELESLYSSWGV